MALTQFMLQMFGRLNNELQAVAPDRPKKILSLGYPDLLASRDFVNQTFGNNLGDKIDYHPDSQSILKWHSAQNLFDGVLDIRALFSELGYEMDVVDIVEARGAEIILDLNEPIDDKFYEQYDIIIDAGTIEHCFNIAQATKNIAQCAREGGYIINCNPFSMFNHGFYNLNPTFYHDFYNQNGFEVVFQQLILDAVHAPKLVEVPPTQRFVNGPINASNILIAYRRKLQDIGWPIQTKYQLNSTLKG